METHKVGPLAVTSNAITTFEAWTKWKRALSYCIDSKSIVNSIRRKAILLHKGGPALQEIYASLEKEHETEALVAKDHYAFALNLLDQHFKPTINRSYERYMFRLLRQNSDPIEQFVVRLRQQANNCEFTDINRELVDQIIFGTSNHDFRTKILEGRMESLEKIVELGKLLESVSVQSRQMAGADSSSCQSISTPDSVARVASDRNSGRGKSSPSSSKFCSACGRRGHENNSPACPAKEGTCYRCEKKGHYANKCPDRAAATTKWSEKTNVTPGPRSSPGNSSRFEGRKRDEVKLVRANRAGESSDDSDDYAFMVTPTSECLPSQLCENRVSLLVGGVRLPFVVDSGSSREIFDAQTWRNLRKKKIEFRPATVTRKLFPYGKARPLNVRRAVSVQFQSVSASVWSTAYILHKSEGQCEPIVGSRVAKALKILRVGDNVSAASAKDDEVRQIIDEKASKLGKVGKLKNFQLSLPLDPAVPPVAQTCRRIPFALRKQLLQRTESLLENDIIERVSGATPWVSNIVPAIKKNGDLRVCIDMRRANQAVLRERFPIPTFDEIVTELRDCEYFSKIDLESAYHQIELTPESREITTFVTPDGLFRFKRLFFGIRCAPEIFQRIMQNLLRDIPHVRVFFDDIIIFSKNKNDHKIHVQQVLERLKTNGLTINLNKSIFGAKQVEFLGHKLSKNVVEPNDMNIAAVKNFNPPECKKDLQSFLGLVNFVSRFIPHYSTLTAPLRGLLKKNSIFRWSESHQKAFDGLKFSVASMKAAIFDPTASISLLTDASPVGLGAVLLQKSEGKQPEIVAFASHSLTPAERNYSQIEREALGLVWGCEKFRMYLLGQSFELLTDHKPLEMLFGPRSKPNARLERWIVRLQCFDYKVRHVAGAANIADPLSRLLQSTPGTTPFSKSIEHTIYRITDLAVPKRFHLDEIREKTSSDEELQAVLEALKSNGSLPAAFLRIKFELAECEGILLRGDRIIPPLSIRKAILEQAHEGHPGAEVMKRRLRSKVWWPKMDGEADLFVKQCLSCTIVGRTDPPPPIQRTALPAQAWEYVAIDHLGPLPSGKYVLVVVDYFSRFVEVAFTSSTSSATTIKLLWRIFSRHGFPARLKSDNAQAFRSAEFETFLSEYGVDHVTTPPLWPQANGEVERQNRSLLKRLKIAASEGLDLEIEACKFLLLYNSTTHSTTGVSPAQLLFHRQIRDKLPSICQPSIQRDTVADRDAEMKFKGKNSADNLRKATPSTLTPGDSVLLQARQTNKLSPTFERDPFTVIEANEKEVVIKRGDQSLRRSVAAVKKCPSPNSSPIRTYAEIVRSSPTQQQKIEDYIQEAAIQSPMSNHEPEVPHHVSSPAITARKTSQPGVTRSGRIVTKPVRLDL